MNDKIIKERWDTVRKELKDFQKWYSIQNKETQDKIQEIINYYDISYDELNKPISNNDKLRLNRSVSEWKRNGIFKGYFKYRVEELMKGTITYRDLIEILLYGAFQEEESIILIGVNNLFTTVATACYNQGRKDLKKPETKKIPKIILETIYLTLIDGIMFEDYMNALYLTNLQEILKDYITNLQQNKKLDVYSDLMQRDFEKQRNRLISINDDSFSGGLDKYTTALGNFAYIEAGGNENQKVKFISDHCDNTTEMCRYMDGMIFNTKERNVFKRPMGKTQKDLEIQEVDVIGLVVGINQPPITEHFHWCHSTLTYIINKTADELRREM